MTVKIPVTGVLSVSVQETSARIYDFPRNGIFSAAKNRRTIENVQKQPHQQYMHTVCTNVELVYRSIQPQRRPRKRIESYSITVT